MTTLAQAVGKYYKTSEYDDLSASAKKRRRIVLNALMRAFPASASVKTLSRDHVDATIRKWRDQGRELSTLNAYKSDLRQFGRYLYVEHRLNRDPAAHLKDQKTRTPATKKKPITATQARELIEIARSVHPCDGMTAALMLFTGLRSAEVVGLTWGRVDFANRDIVAYRSKIEDDHHAYIPDPLMEEFERWKAYYIGQVGEIKNEWYVVPARAHKSELPGHFRMHPDWPIVPDKRQNNLGERVKLWLLAVGETDLKGRAAHTLRRTAGNLYREITGADMRAVMNFFGHDTEAMSENYLDQSVARQESRKFAENFIF